MQIDFKGPAAEAEGGITYQAAVDGKPVTCLFLSQALEDVNPETSEYSKSDQFAFNQERLLAIATENIRKGRIENGKVSITASDV